MVRWVKYLYDKKNIRQLNIIDDNFTYHIKYAKEFCRRMIELDLPNLRFCTPNGIRQEKTDFELLTLMKKAGWDYVFIAPESGSMKTLQRMQKDLDPKTIPQKVRPKLAQDRFWRIYLFEYISFSALSRNPYL